MYDCLLLSNDGFIIRAFLLKTLFLKKCFEYLVVKLFQYAADSFKLVVAFGEGIKICSAANASHLWVGQAIIDFSNTSDNEGTRAHRTGLFGDVEGAFI